MVALTPVVRMPLGDQQVQKLIRWELVLFLCASFQVALFIFPSKFHVDSLIQVFALRLES